MGADTVNIKALRLKRNLLQSDIAEKMNIDRSTVAKWETGATYPRADKLPELAKILRCSMNQLMKKSEES